MGDHVEIQITPETPGRPSIRNPFESPNDYHQLREPLVPSPSVFNSKNHSTPPKFNWSIDEMASLLPVHIDPEDIQRQSFYLSQTRTDSDIEEKRQNAIEEFFTKGTIVPSPWAPPDSRKGTHTYKKSEKPGFKSVTFSLNISFFSLSLSGDYYRYDEACDAVTESLSSSSLRRKLFLDGQSSYSSGDSSGASSPERNSAEPGRSSFHKRDEAVTDSQEEALSIFSSPLPCGISAQTPSTGQFSSSPIQRGRFRDCSLGSISSPLFPDRSSPAGLGSPTISPIVAHTAHTPTNSAEKLQTHLTPLGAPLEVGGASCNESPFVEGCSPIHSCSPLQSKPRPRMHCWASPPLLSAAPSRDLQENQEAEDHLSFSTSSLHPMELDQSSPLARCGRSADAEGVSPTAAEALIIDEDKEGETKEKLGNEEEEDRRPLGQLTSSRMGNMSTIEGSQMFVSLLIEGSSIRCDSSMQVDSGYNTTSAGTASLIDGLSSDCHSSNLMEDAFQVPRHTKVKVFYPHH
uniref:Protein aurora borealis n=1 Tax=Salarias fasciatus TaxID=181472 RepID=A0A672GY56_SALFA